MQRLLGNVPYPVRSPDEDWTSPSVFLLNLWEGFQREAPSLDIANVQLKEECLGCGSLLVEICQKDTANVMVNMDVNLVATWNLLITNPDRAFKLQPVAF